VDLGVARSEEKAGGWIYNEICKVLLKKTREKSLNGEIIDITPLRDCATWRGGDL